MKRAQVPEISAQIDPAATPQRKQNELVSVQMKLRMLMNMKRMSSFAPVAVAPPIPDIRKTEYKNLYSMLKPGMGPACVQRLEYSRSESKYSCYCTSFRTYADQ